VNLRNACLAVGFERKQHFEEAFHDSFHDLERHSEMSY